MLKPLSGMVAARLPSAVRADLGVQRSVVLERGAVYAARWNAMLAAAWMRDRAIGRRAYRFLDETALRAVPRSDTVFVFGSGSSLNDIAPQEWHKIERHDTFGFNAFYNQNWIRTDFHLLRGGVYGELRWRPHAEEVHARIAQNPLFAETVFLMQEDFLGSFANQLAGHRLLPPNARLFRYRTARGAGLPTKSFAQGVRHAPGTLSDAVNCAYLIGWKRIVLAGVDLYDSRYFWLPSDRTLAYDAASATLVPAERNNIRGNRYDEPHNTARSGVVAQMASWRQAVAEDGVELYVYNPRSLLASVLPVYRRASSAS